MTLTEILQQEFLNPIYASMTDQEAFDYITDPTIVSIGNISVQGIEKYLAVKLKLLAIEDSTNISARGFVRVLKIFDQIPLDETDILNLLNKLLNGIVAEGLITTGEKEELVAMGNKTISIAKELGISNLTLQAVIVARV